MKLRILFDNYSVDEKRFKIGWGFSCLIEEEVLFDTGENGDILLRNAKEMGVEMKKVKKIIISHDHYDHTGGLKSLLQLNKEVKVFLLPDFSKKLKERVLQSGGEVVENEVPLEIHTDIYTTGKIEGVYAGRFMPEQSLVIRKGEGLVLLTGCSHPGIVNIVERVKEVFPGERFLLVLGGFHLLEKERREVEVVVNKMRELGVRRVGPTHCSGSEAIQVFKERYGRDFVSLGAGAIMEI